MNHGGQDLFWGYRPLITHTRKRSTIPAREQPENHPAHHALLMQAPWPSTRRGFARPDEAAVFKSKVEALIERFKPFAARTRERH